MGLESLILRAKPNTHQVRVPACGSACGSYGVLFCAFRYAGTKQKPYTTAASPLAALAKQ
jgi:hypothetical protein